MILVDYITILTWKDDEKLVSFINKYADKLHKDCDRVQLTLDFIEGGVNGEVDGGLGYNPDNYTIDGFLEWIPELCIGIEKDENENSVYVLNEIIKFDP
ncbi:MAG: hypothetical protein VW438_02575 [Euryarchaeota archaeon]